MKKILISLLIVLLLALVIVTCTNGLKIGGIEILSFGQIQEHNKELDDTILQATTLASTDYDNALKAIDTDIKKLQEEKKKYDDLVSVSTGSEVQAANQYQKYEIEYLWTIIGNHAKKEGVVIKMDLSAGTGENVYNLNFTVTGEYIGISDFISDIENDSALGFKIENFYLVPSSSTDTLKATFVCKDITIRDVANSVKKSTTNTKDENTTDSNTNTTDKNGTTTNTNNTGTNSSNNTTTNNNTGTNDGNNSTTNNNSSTSSNTNNSNTTIEDDAEELTKLDR